MSQLQKWEILRSQLVFDHRWCKVRQDVVRLPDGQIIDDYFLNLKPDIALVFPITAERDVVCVRQYRHGAREILLELPAGAFDPTLESAEAAARRELEEETAYVATHLTSLGILYDNPVKDTNKIHLFLAKDVQPLGQRQLDTTEDIEIVLIPMTDILTMVRRGEICVAGSVAAIVLALQWLQGRDGELP